MMNSRSPHETDDQLANLIKHLPDGSNGPRSLAFVSSNPGEGTSTSLAHVARYLASDLEASVLIVDCNLRSPSLHDVAGVERQNGLAEILAGTVELEEAVKASRVKNLSLVTSGVNGQSPQRLFERDAIRERLLNRTSSYDFVLFDLPPVNQYPEATVVASLCDGVVLVVLGESTRREVAARAKQELLDAHCRLIGVFMNKRKFYIPRKLYGRF